MVEEFDQIPSSSSVIVDDEFFPSEILSLQGFDLFIHEAQEFVNQCRNSTSGCSSSSSILSSFWTKKSHLRKTLSDLNVKEAKMDTELRKMVSDSLEKVGSLGLQARHLINRLRSCIHASAEDVSDLTEYLQYLKDMSDELSSADMSTRQQLHFVNAVMEQRDVQIDRCMTALLQLGNDNNWTDVSEHECAVGSFTTKDRALVVKRLHLIREAQAETNACYTLLLHRRQVREQTLKCLMTVRDRLLKAPLEVDFDTTSCENSNSSDKGSGERGSSSEGKHEVSRDDNIAVVNEGCSCDRIGEFGLQQQGRGIDKEDSTVYDHTLCSDCTVVADLAHECLCRLLRMQKVACESHCRLQRLLFLREDLLDIGTQLHAPPTSQK